MNGCVAHLGADCKHWVLVSKTVIRTEKLAVPDALQVQSGLVRCLRVCGDVLRLCSVVVDHLNASDMALFSACLLPQATAYEIKQSCPSLE